MKNGWKRGALVIALFGLATTSAAADPASGNVGTLAMATPGAALPSATSVRDGANALFECPPLNIDPMAMSCGSSAFDYVTLARVPFDYDKSNVNAPAAMSLDAAAIYLLLNADKVHRVFVNGHADSTGTDAYNDRLSQKRATAVMKYLVNRGVAGDKLALGASGERHPVDEHWTPEGRTSNRNVSLYVVMRRPAQ